MPARATISTISATKKRVLREVERGAIPSVSTSARYLEPGGFEAPGARSAGGVCDVVSTAGARGRAQQREALPRASAQGPADPPTSSGLRPASPAGRGA